MSENSMSLLKSRKVPLSSPLPQFKSWRQQLVLPSPPPPKHSTRPVRRWPQINPLPSTSTSGGPSPGGPPSGSAITCGHPNLKPLNMVTTHRTESCPAIAQLPPPPTIDDSHVALWMLLRVYGLSGSQAPSPILIPDSDSDPSPTKSYQALGSKGKAKEVSRTRIHSPILILDSDSDPSPTKSYQALASKGTAKEVSRTRIHSPILISDSDAEPKLPLTKGGKAPVSKGKGKEVDRSEVLVVDSSDEDEDMEYLSNVSIYVVHNVYKSFLVNLYCREKPSPRKVEKNIEVFRIPMTVAASKGRLPFSGPFLRFCDLRPQVGKDFPACCIKFWMEKSKKKIGKQLNGLDLIKPRFYCCNLLKVSFMKTDGGFEGVIQRLSQMPAGGKIDTAR
ncbi:hypothetical protein C8R42DRAFT_637091 [Lentinula raphanica]|nr:hypothetical protein C8R42DRAFT_637091 [Lentinula raphanica]